MKSIITLAFIICGTLLIATPFIYAYFQHVSVESLIDEFITYVCMGAGIYSLFLAHKSLDKLTTNRD
jgi:hypothetical protein